MSKFWIILCLSCVIEASVFSQASVFIPSGIYVVSGGNTQISLQGNLQTNGTITGSSNSGWRFAGLQQQKITCLQGSACTQNFQYSCSPSSYTTSFGNLILDNPSGMRIETNSAVAGVYQFINGKCEISDASLWIKNAGSYSGSGPDNFFATIGKGLLIQPGATATLYPLSSNSNVANYAPASVTYAGPSNLLGIRLADSAYNYFNAADGTPTTAAVNHHRVAKTWTTHECNPGTGQYTFNLYWKTSHEYYDFNRNYCEVILYDYTTLFWDQVMGYNAAQASGLAGTNYFQTRSFNVGYQFLWKPMIVEDVYNFLSDDQFRLAVERSGNNALLRFSSSEADDIDKYVILFSTGTSSFTEIGTLNATGSGLFQYQFTQTNITSYLNSSRIRLFYKVKKIHRNGRIQFSNLESLLIDKPSSLSLQLYPIPCHTELNARVANIQPTSLQYTIYDAAGRPVLQKSLTPAPGDPSLICTISTTHLSSGIYYFMIQIGSNTISQKFVVLH